ncbi:uncharacterized protein MONBRDRAFT_31391 [Monosiga brevicollis MX1]|uniref:Uncharacterized protein n=1 Tax=Monosiga brevicollis TaxID=81824 RepID=A9USW8_MONBE|nr:uncharacterized protein MONBRDRAFT_31391 [Monosiga brevicollis MX1]EDQ91395.1 predicted protein [Monosiga brevicollis MX1]|eukprot:XP_001743817.1 hypothetical protein [Monosiga brevicollis MX1]
MDSMDASDELGHPVASEARDRARQRLAQGNKWIVWDDRQETLTHDASGRLAFPRVEEAVTAARSEEGCLGVYVAHLANKEDWKMRLFDQTQPLPCGKLSCAGCMRANNLKNCPTPGCKSRIRKAQRKACSMCGKLPSNSGPAVIDSPEAYAKAITDVKKHLEKIKTLMDNLNATRQGSLFAFHLLINPWSGDRLTAVDQRKRENGVVMSGWYGDCTSLPAEALHRRDGRINIHPKDKERINHFVHRDNIFTWAMLVAGAHLREANATEIQLKSQASRTTTNSCPNCPAIPDTEHMMLPSEHHHMGHYVNQHGMVLPALPHPAMMSHHADSHPDADQAYKTAADAALPPVGQPAANAVATPPVSSQAGLADQAAAQHAGLAQQDGVEHAAMAMAGLAQRHPDGSHALLMPGMAQPMLDGMDTGHYQSIANSMTSSNPPMYPYPPMYSHMEVAHQLPPEQLPDMQEREREAQHACRHDASLKRSPGP